jgi:hypothetical protein
MQDDFDFENDDVSVDLDDNESTNESTKSPSSAKELEEIRAMFEGKINAQEEKIKHLRTHTQKITSALKSLGDPQAGEMSESQAQYQRDIDAVKEQLITPEIVEIKRQLFGNALDSAGLDPDVVSAGFEYERVKALKSKDTGKIEQLAKLYDLYEAGKYSSLATHWKKFKGEELPSRSISFGVPITGQSGAGEKAGIDFDKLIKDIQEVQGDPEELVKMQQKMQKMYSKS